MKGCNNIVNKQDAKEKTVQSMCDNYNITFPNSYSPYR